MPQTSPVADDLGLDGRTRRDAEFTALLHDVGKIRIPGQIINKPGPLTDDERAVINRHTLQGEEMLERVGGLLGDVGRLVRSCHERYDGQGTRTASRVRRSRSSLGSSPVATPTAP